MPRSPATPAFDRILLDEAGVTQRVLDPAAVYFLEATGDLTRVRTRGARPYIDHRPLGGLLPLFAPHGFLRVHRNHAVNLRRIRLLRRRKQGPDWELKLTPPVSAILPISRAHLEELRAALGAT